MGTGRASPWLVDRLSPLLLAQARHRLPARFDLGIEPEDLVHDVWAVALRALPTLEPRGTRGTPALLRFLSTTLLHKVNERLRGEARRRRRGTDSEGAAPGLDDLPADTVGVIGRVLRSEEAEAVRAALAGLSEKDHEVVVLRGIEGHGCERVGQLTGLSPNAVSLRWNRALKRLREALPGGAPDDLDEDPAG